MRNIKKCAVTVAALSAGALLLSGCSSTDSPAATPSGESSTSSGPVEIDYWGWEATSTQQVVDAYNAAQDKYKIHYVLQASNTATQTAFQNLMSAGGQTVPCIVQGFTGLTSAVASGWTQDITKYVDQHKDVWSKGSLAGSQVNGKFMGLPSGVDAQFVMVNDAVLKAAGVDVPTTWEDVLADAPKLKAVGAATLNLPGEDPSGFVNLAQQAGAVWFAIDGDKWKVNLLDDATLKAADFYQKIIDGGFASNATYQDKPALYAAFDGGKLAFLPTAWWSMNGYADNFDTSLGQWHAVKGPTFADAPSSGVPGKSVSNFVPKDCKHPEAAVDFTAWATTDAGIEASRNATTGQVNFPTSIPDPSKYVTDIVPDKLFDQPKSEVGDVVVDAQSRAIGVFEQGPNNNAWFPELQDQWGKAVAGQQTLKQALQNTQDFIAKDLDTKGISYKIG